MSNRNVDNTFNKKHPRSINKRTGFNASVHRSKKNSQLQCRQRHIPIMWKNHRDPLIFVKLLVEWMRSSTCSTWGIIAAIRPLWIGHNSNATAIAVELFGEENPYSMALTEDVNYVAPTYHSDQCQGSLVTPLAASPHWKPWQSMSALLSSSVAFTLAVIREFTPST